MSNQRNGGGSSSAIDGAEKVAFRFAASHLALIIGSLAIVLLAFALSSPIPQDPNYHAFADGREFFGVANFWDVISNIPFLIVGAWGLVIVRRHSLLVCAPGLEIAYTVFFAGIWLTAFGSGYYHLAPGNETLVWDRLPMTIGFAGLFAIVVGEYVSVRVARKAIVLLLVLGISSVVYWAVTEARGAGDLRPYAVMQFLPLLLIPAILVMYRPAIGARKYYWVMLFFYLLAKVFEYLDAEVFAATGMLSGHTLKHVLASLTPATLLYALFVRRHTATLPDEPGS